ncbi:MAG: CDP-alcohol phosphatidyltransferase family protein [Anaerolineae bacterium]
MNDKKDKFDFTQWARDVMDPIFDPLLSLFVILRITPNMLTVAGTLGHFVAVWFLSQGRITAAGIALILLAPLDAMDGALARKMNQPYSPFGAFLDSTLDRVSEIILFGGIIYYYYLVDNPTMMIVAFTGIGGSFMVSYARAKAETLNLDGKVGFFGRLERYLVIVNLMILGQLTLAMWIVAVLSWITAGQRFYSVYRQLMGKANEDNS